MWVGREREDKGWKGEGKMRGSREGERNKKEW